MKRVGFRWLARGSCRHSEAMTIRGGSRCSVDFPAMVGVIHHPERGILLFDTGYDPAFIAETHSFPERLYRWTTPVSIGPELEWRQWIAAQGVDPADISGVIISHFHGDHVAGLRHLAGLPLYCARAGLDNLRRPGRFRRVRQGLLAGLVPPACDEQAQFFEQAPEILLPDAFTPFTSGRDILGDGSLLAVELPGHCPGHWGLALRTQDDRYLLLAADAVWSARAIEQRRPPPRLTTALLGDTPMYRTTLDRLHQAHVRNRDLVILPSHCAQAAARFEQGGSDGN
ncbi:MBL fold metallo-hydrolase [Altererythrobacter xixiisoli]|uniref:MBL fold metallo-hydrolase n=1 Tax=Croceibacterium xixiisoli TaxID=1476466 RepID=A0A6I4TSP9_9SPHN|nr:MBL fold metallo-hydrolase [Croceibacterium xixiisoli]MXO97937.1 MBL fold metallo-hydrolase [Croceibacterium xixiisoli]